MMRFASHGLVALTALSIACPVAFAEFICPEKPGDPLIYGVRIGICVAFRPSALDGRHDGGPRGLIRVGYEENGRYCLINYIAIEPIVASVPGLLELEKGGGRSFRRFGHFDGLSLTTFGSRGDADPGRLNQSFRVPADAEELRFALHSGSDARTTYVIL
jgi:hypothetical protein